MRYERLQGKRYIGLVRCSTAGQVDTSIEDQLVVLAAFAREHEMTGVDSVQLEGVSGSIPGNRTDIEQLIDRKKSRNDFDVLLVQDTTRLTRSGPKHGAKIEYDLEAAGIDVVFVTDNLPEGEFGDIYKSILYFSGKQQAKSISMTSARGSMSSLLQGRSAHCKRPPYGIDRLYVAPDGTPNHVIRNLTDGTQVKLDPKTGEVIGRFGANEKKGIPRHYIKQKDEKVLLIPGADEHLTVVRRIYSQHHIEKWGYSRIAQELNTQGVPAPSGGEWSVTQVRKILLNTIYIGMGIANQCSSAIYHMRAPESPCPVVVDAKSLATRKRPPLRVRPRKDWHERQEPQLAGLLDAKLQDLARRKQERHLDDLSTGRLPQFSRDRHTQTEFILKNLLTSKQGGHRLTGRRTGRKSSQKRYYAISRAWSNPGSDRTLRKMIPAEPVEQAVLSILRKVMSMTPDLQSQVQQAVDCCRRASAHDGSDLPTLLKQQASLQRKIEFAIDELDAIGRDALRSKMTKLQSQLQTVDEQIRQARATSLLPQDDPTAATTRIVDHLSRLAGSFDQLPSTAIRRLLEVVIERAEVDLETREVELSLRMPSWAVEHVDAMCLDDTFACKPVIEAHPECGILLVKMRFAWSKPMHDYIGYDFAA